MTKKIAAKKPSRPRNPRRQDTNLGNQHVTRRLIEKLTDRVAYLEEALESLLANWPKTR